jgi:O-antigen/teichoic acid export membrane protein
MDGLSEAGHQKDSGSPPALRAGVWYTATIVFTRASGLITVPLFARLLTKEEFGTYSNFVVVVLIVGILTGFRGSLAIPRMKLDLGGQIDRFCFSTLALTSIITLVCYGLSLLFKQAIMGLLGLSEIYLHIMFVYLLAFHAFEIMASRARAFYRYRLFAILSAGSTLGGAALSLVFVVFFRDHLLGRTIGQYLPGTLIGFGLYVFLAIKSKGITFKYWGTVAALCLPLVPNVLSLYVLSSSDRIMITAYWGAANTALYALAASLASIVGVLFHAMNDAWSPWLFERLSLGAAGIVRRASSEYFLVCMTLCVTVILLSPEAIGLLGGKSFQDSLGLAPPLIVGSLFQASYGLYANLQFYCKKTVGIAVGSVVAASVNLVLNLILVPQFGMYAAAYDALVGYGVLLAAHYLLVRRLDYHRVYSVKVIVGGTVGCIGLIPVALWSYDHVVFRFCLLGTLVGGSAAWLVTRRRAQRMEDEGQGGGRMREEI